MVGAWIVVLMYGNLTNEGRMFLGTTGNVGEGFIVSSEKSGMTKPTFI